jgi:hypothetical protein
MVFLPGSPYWDIAHETYLGLKKGSSFGAEELVASSSEPFGGTMASGEASSLGGSFEVSSDVEVLTETARREVYSGSLEPPSITTGYSSEFQARTAGGVLLHATPSADAPSVPLPAGRSLEVLQLDPSSGWAKVLEENGSMGYVKDVRRIALDQPNISVVKYASGALDAPLVDDSAVLRLAERFRATDALFRITMAPASAAGGRPVFQTAYLRSIRLRQMLADLGISRDRVQLVVPDGKQGLQDTSDVAVLSVLLRSE